MHKIITRAEAKAAGLRRYFTGEPCKYGHIEERVASHGDCVKCKQENKRRYYASKPKKKQEMKRRAQQRWAATHPENAKEIRRRYKTKKQCAEVSASIDRGLQRATASGILMDAREAMDVFKANDNAFEFLNE